MFLKQINSFIFRRLKRIVYEMVRSAENDELAKKIDRTLHLLKFCGYGIKINGSFTIEYPHNVSIGNNVHIGRNAFFHGYGGLTISDNVHISRNVTIYTYNHDYAGEVLPYDNRMVRKPVYIGKNVWIGMNVSIIPGVNIGDGAILGIGTIVSQDIPSLAIVGNPPPRVIKYRDKDHYVMHENRSSYGGVGGTPLNSTEIRKFKSNAANQ